MSARGLVAVPAMLTAGGLVAVQAEVNGRLSEALGSGPRAGFTAAVVHFGSGLVLVAVLTLLIPSGRRGLRALRAARSSGLLPRYLMLGGGFGAFVVATQGLTVGSIGVALFTVGLTAGMSANALVADHYGMGPSGRASLSPPRVVAAVFTVGAVALAGGERLIGTFSWTTAVLVILPVLAGAGAAFQTAFNGQVSAIGGPWATTLNNFVIGLGALLGCLGASFLADGELRGLPHGWWLYTGGAIGVMFIWLAAALVKVYGVLVLSLTTIAGQVITAELIELAGPSAHVGPAGVGAGVLAVAGVALALVTRAVGRRRASHPTR